MVIFVIVPAICHATAVNIDRKERFLKCVQHYSTYGIQLLGARRMIWSIDVLCLTTFFKFIILFDFFVAFSLVMLQLQKNKKSLHFIC